jgi:hypothetical protein
MRFAYSPLVEVAESLYMLSYGSVEPVHRAWYGAVRRRLNRVDLELLQAVVPAHSYIADFLLPGATYPAHRAGIAVADASRAVRATSR